MQHNIYLCDKYPIHGYRYYEFEQSISRSSKNWNLDTKQLLTMSTTFLVMERKSTTGHLVSYFMKWYAVDRHSELVTGQMKPEDFIKGNSQFNFRRIFNFAF